MGHAGGATSKGLREAVRNRGGQRPSVLASEPLIFGPDHVLAIHAFEPADSEMPPRHILEMLDKRIVHGSPTERADDRDGLSSDLLRHHQTEAGCHLREEAD